MAGLLKEEIVNLALTTTTWQAVSSAKKASVFNARTRANNNWLISNDPNGTTYFTVVGTVILKYTIETPGEGIIFYAQGAAADILEVLFE